MGEPIVTLHAVARFAERILGIPEASDFSRVHLALTLERHGIRFVDIERMIAAAVVDYIGLPGIQAIVKSGIRFVVEDRHVVTVTPSKWRTVPTGRKKNSKLKRLRVVTVNDTVPWFLE